MKITPLILLREKLTAPRADGRTSTRMAAGALAVAFGLTASLALAPPALPSEAAILAAYADANAQGAAISASKVAADLESTGETSRDDYDATVGLETLKAGGTNYDWAKMVLLFAGYPMTDSNVTVITRWMRQENYVKSWWNRNNPLNNGWGASAGAGGTGRNVDLVAAARNAAEALTTLSRYAGMNAAFQASESTTAVEQAIWASPWASGHYNNGAHWHYTEVEVVQAPASAWG